MSVQVTAERTLGECADPLTEPELTLHECITRTRDAVLERMAVDKIVQDARAAHPSDHDAARAEAVALVINWFDRYVETGAFDADVLNEARRQVYEVVLRDLTKLY